METCPTKGGRYHNERPPSLCQLESVKPAVLTILLAQIIVFVNAYQTLEQQLAA
jgi:hypothetical protein